MFFWCRGGVVFLRYFIYLFIFVSLLIYSDDSSFATLMTHHTCMQRNAHIRISCILHKHMQENNNNKKSVEGKEKEIILFIPFNPTVRREEKGKMYEREGKLFIRLWYPIWYVRMNVYKEGYREREREWVGGVGTFQ